MRGARPLCGLVLAAALFSAPVDAATTITIAGSTTLLPLLNDAAQAFEYDHTDVMVVVSGGGSRPALSQLASKQIDLAASDLRPEGDADLIDHRIAVIGFAIAIDPRANVQNLTRAEIADIFAGRLTNWKDVGGRDMQIVVVDRPPGSGVRELVAQRLMGNADFAKAPLQDESTSTLVSDLQSTMGSVGYGTLAGLRAKGLVLASIDGTAPTDENIESGAYPLWAYEHIVTNGQPTPDESRFLAYIQSNRDLLKRYGYISVADMKVSPPDT